VVVWFRSLSEVRRGCSDGVAWYGDHINSCCYNYSMQAIVWKLPQRVGDTLLFLLSWHAWPSPVTCLIVPSIAILTRIQADQRNDSLCLCKGTP
jgi:hypothetical protein